MLIHPLLFLLLAPVPRSPQGRIHSGHVRRWLQTSGQETGVGGMYVGSPSILSFSPKHYHLLL